MKTPREILLEQHRHIEPRLEEIRRRVLSAKPSAAEEEAEPSAWLITLWRELILPCRQAWAVLAVAWGVILLLQLSADGRLAFPHNVSAEPTPDVMAQLKEQWLLRAELLGTIATEPEPSARPNQPHSQALPGSSTAFHRPDSERV